MQRWGKKISTVKEEMGGGRAFGGVVGPRLEIAKASVTLDSQTVVRQAAHTMTASKPACLCLCLLIRYLFASPALNMLTQTVVS